MKITVIFPARSVEPTRATVATMPPSLTLLAALTPDRHEVRLVEGIGIISGSLQRPIT
jgi:hypothetical protein